MKSPFNWVGNKYKYIGTINDLVRDKKYNDVVDCFMGSGNILLNLECTANRFIGNDKNRLLPYIYERIRVIDNFNIHQIEITLNQWNRFSSKEDYYNFREYWNKKYKNNRFDDAFIYETALLLKMCSNSMVRFNSKGEFNQGFRGLGKKTEFFTDTMKKI
ncbi:MAG: DNA adenine methylase, partial [Intestinibacter bartlettii]|nr:DNA adenine methylase [Intestinibacter bartlettii]